MGLGFMYISVMEKAGISTGNPPACQTPRFTISARSRRCRWQGLISLQVLMMAITGRPVKSSRRKPSCFSRERCPKPRSVSGANHRRLRRSSGFVGMIQNRLENSRDFFEDVGLRPVAHDLEIAVAGIVGDHRSRHFVIGAQALANDVALIVFAHDEGSAVVVALAFDFRPV